MSKAAKTALNVTPYLLYPLLTPHQDVFLTWDLLAEHALQRAMRFRGGFPVEYQSICVRVCRFGQDSIPTVGR